MRSASFIVMAAIVAMIVATTAWQRSIPAPFGFSEASAPEQSEIERRFLQMPSADRIRESNRFFSSAPHIAGSPRDRELADYIRDQFTAFGFETVTMSTYDVLLPWPIETSVEMVAPRAWRASMRETPIAGDVDTAPTDQPLRVPYHAYSASGDVTARLVYAGMGAPEDYEHLAAMGVDVRGAIVLVRH